MRSAVALVLSLSLSCCSSAPSHAEPARAERVPDAQVDCSTMFYEHQVGVVESLRRDHKGILAKCEITGGSEVYLLVSLLEIERPGERPFKLEPGDEIGLWNATDHARHVGLVQPPGDPVRASRGEIRWMLLKQGELMGRPAWKWHFLVVGKPVSETS